METDIAFDLNSPDYSVHRLLPEDAPALQGLFEKCLDYFLLVDGRAPAPNEAEEEFHAVPPGKSLDDKFLFGIVNPRGELAGALEGLRHYPDERTWWIGLLLVAPESRAHRLGRKVVQGFADYVLARGGQTLMLGVVEANLPARRFWQKLGFDVVRQTEPRPFGVKLQTVSVMQRSLVEFNGKS